MVAMAIGSLLIGAVVSVSVSSSRSLASLFNVVNLNEANRLALDQMSRELRQARYVSDLGTNELTFVDWDDQKVIYRYVPSDRALLRSKNGVDQVLLTGCDDLTFRLFQRTTTAGSFKQTVAATATGRKVVSVNWTCSRDIMGMKANEETVQSAKIILRN